MSRRRGAGHVLALLQWTGILLTILWLALWAPYLAEASVEEILELDPFKLAEFLAGIVGPLILLWLVLGHMQQGHQIRWDIAQRNDATHRRAVLDVAHRLAESDAYAEQTTALIGELRSTDEEMRASLDRMRRLSEEHDETTRSACDAIHLSMDRSMRRAESIEALLGEVQRNNKKLWRSVHSSAREETPLIFADVIMAVEHSMRAKVVLRQLEAVGRRMRLHATALSEITSR